MRSKQYRQYGGETVRDQEPIWYARESLRGALNNRSVSELEYAHCVVNYLNVFQESYFTKQSHPAVCDEDGLVRLLCSEVEYLAGGETGRCCYVDIMNAYRCYITDDTSSLHKELRLDRRPRASIMVLLDEITKLCPLPANEEAYVSPSSVAS